MSVGEEGSAPVGEEGSVSVGEEEDSLSVGKEGSVSVGEEDSVSVIGSGMLVVGDGDVGVFVSGDDSASEGGTLAFSVLPSWLVGRMVSPSELFVSVVVDR